MADTARVSPVGVARIAVTCARTVPCAGTLTLTIKLRGASPHGSAPAVTLTLGAVRYRVKTGARTTLAIRISSSGLALLKATRHHRLGVWVSGLAGAGGARAAVRLELG